jgi:hypothetical protein
LKGESTGRKKSACSPVPIQNQTAQAVEKERLKKPKSGWVKCNVDATFVKPASEWRMGSNPKRPKW